MRMEFFFGNIFWGLLVILFGVSIILRGFNINLPLVKVFFAIMIILFGVRLLVGGKSKPTHHKHNYQRGVTRSYERNRQEYAFVFSGGTLDLTNIKPDAKDMEITVVFGAATVILPADVKFDIEPSTVFGATYLPQNNYFGLAEDDVTLNPDGKNRPIHIESTAVFGRLEYVVKDMPSQPQTTTPGDSTATTSEF